MDRRFSTQQRWTRLLLTLVVTFSVAVQLANTQTRTKKKETATPQPTPTASPVVPPNPLVIAIPAIAAEAIQLNQKLRSLPERIVSSESLAQIEQQINELKETTGNNAQQTELAIQSGAIYASLQESSRDWEALNKEVEGLSKTLISQATALENEIKSLRTDEARWRATNEEVRSQESPPEILDLTAKAVADIDAAVKVVEERRDRVVGLQQSLAAQSSIIANEIDHLKKAMAQSQRSLLEPESPRLWKVQFGTQAEDSLTRRLLRGTYAEDLTRVEAFIREKRAPLVIVALLTIVLSGFLVRLSRAAKTRTADEHLRDTNSILQRPVSLSVLIALVAILPLLYDAPLSVVGLANLIGIVPVIRLLNPQLSKLSQRMLIALVVSVLLFHVVKFVQFPTWIKRDVLALLTLLVIAMFGFSTREARRVNPDRHPGPTLVLGANYVGIALLSVAFLANLFGYVRLSDLLTQGTLVSAYRAVALYTIFVVGNFLIAFVLQAKSAQRFAVFRTGSDRISGRTTFALGLTLLLVWVHTTLGLFAIREDVYRAIGRALNYQITIGSASFAVSNIVAFVLTLFFGYLLASIIRAILGEEILPRLKLARGVPNAIATVTYYIALVLIFLLALAASGVELSKFTILTGAFGVGLGFGLQNVVNNFVSGLILLFERPVRVGDFLEIGGVSGQVTKIGFRSSTLHAADGSDVIIPNANLIAQQVINWTLTGTRRQILLNVHVAYNTDPTLVRDLLRTTAAAHPEVLDFPKPTALFLGFGDNALNFEVRFWASRPEVVPELRSEVSLSIAAALNEAGIKVPQPLVHISRSDETAKEAVVTSGKDGG